MVDLRPLLLINALAFMLLLTAGFAHIKNPDAPELAAFAALPALDLSPLTGEAETQPAQSTPSIEVEEDEVFADVQDTATEVSATPASPFAPATDATAGTMTAALDPALSTSPVTGTAPSQVPATDLQKADLQQVTAPPVGTLTVRSNVHDDRVRINGQDYGSTRLNLELAPGKYVIEVTKPGYKGWSQTVDLARDDQLIVHATLEELTQVEFRNGTWRHGVVTGQGTYRAADGTFYEGGFLDKQFHGNGKLQRPDGARYEGEWVNGKKEGYGTLKLPDGDTYTGYFQRDLFNGEGTLTKSNGDIYTGHWVDGKLNGEGSLTTPQGLMYVGTFVDNEFGGTGEITYPDGTHYTGGFSKSLFHGNGVLTYRDGKKYIGQFIEGQYHGKGELLNPNGSKISGTFKFGKPYGQATLTTPAGEVFTARSSEPGVCYRLKSYRATQCPPMEGW